MTDKRKLFKKIFFLGLSSANGVRYSRCKAKKQIMLIGGCGASHTREAACYRKPQLLK